MDLFDDNEENCVSDKEYHNYITFAKRTYPRAFFIWGIVTRCFFILNQNVNSRREQVIEKNAELTIQNSDLQKKVVELHHVSDECQQLKSTLNKVESECVTAQSEVRNLSGKVRNLECVLEEMHKAAENRREIERQHKEVISLNFLLISHFY